jgi:fatty acid desaturase
MAARAQMRDYSLAGGESERAIARGLASAEWYRTDIPRKTLKQLMERSDGPAIRDTIIWLGLLAASGSGACIFWGTWWAVPFFVCYGALYGSASDSRWHECGHGTAFRTAWLNVAIYYLASFMIFREPTVWRWSHARHHTDTIIVGRDREIHATRPPDLVSILLGYFAIKTTPATAKSLLLHALGRMTPEEISYVPVTERGRVFAEARVFLGMHLAVVVVAVVAGSFLPLMLAGVLPTMYGAWLGVYVGYTQHAGLAEDVLDHRLNTRTVYMNPVFRFTYWNMNYHVEHHMFPMVPFHQLPRLHEIVRADTPRPYRSTLEAYAEIIPTLIRQLREPDYFVRRKLPAGCRQQAAANGGVTVAGAAE